MGKAKLAKADNHTFGGAVLAYEALLSHYPELYEQALRFKSHQFTPLADPSAVGTAVPERKKELWRFAVSEETVNAANFQPEHT